VNYFKLFTPVFYSENIPSTVPVETDKLLLIMSPSQPGASHHSERTFLIRTVGETELNFWFLEIVLISDGSYRPGAVELLQEFDYGFSRFVHDLQHNDYTVPGEDLQGNSVEVYVFYYVILLNSQIINSP